jgi:hypothetical protein
MFHLADKASGERLFGLDVIEWSMLLFAIALLALMVFLA